jgi:endo-1,3-1,4-beta-glycanase ExoK
MKEFEMYRYFSFVSLIGVVFCSHAWALDYKAAEVYSADSFTCGKFETRFRTMNGGGLLSTFFLMNQDLTNWRELDCEVFGKDGGTKYQTNIKDSAPINHEGNHTASSSLADAYHTYAIEWTPKYFAWYFDGVQIRKETMMVDKFTLPMRIRFNAWPATPDLAGWAGSINQANIPNYQFINWIKYYKYTPGQGSAGSDFTLSFTDNFDTVDTLKWKFADWSFPGNNAIFTKANAVCKNGFLILCITKSPDSGFAATKAVPPDPSDPTGINKSTPISQNAPVLRVSYKNASLNLQYPNDRGAGAALISIYDCKGALLYTHTVKATDQQNTYALSLPIIALRSGAYICRIKSDHYSDVARFTVQ